MKYAANFREMARDALSGKWRVAILTGFCAQLLGATFMTGSFAGSSSSEEHSSHYEALPQSFNMDPFVIHRILLVVLAAALIWAIVLFVVSGAAKLGYARFNLKLVDGDDAHFSDLFSRFDRLGSGIIMNLLMGLFTFLWMLLFIIPGIIKAYSYSMTPFILSEHPEISENEAITRSRKLMKGNKWRLFCLLLSFIGWEILIITPLLISLIFLPLVLLSGAHAAGIGIIILCAASALFAFIGQLFLVPYQNAAVAAFYRDITNEADYGDTDSYETDRS